MTTTGYQHSDPNVERWHGPALNAGWHESDWPRLSCIIQRESRGNPRAFNGSGRDESYGLLQMNMKAHRSWVRDLLGPDYKELLFDGSVNLHMGRVLFNKAGWGPWSSTDRPC